MTIQATYANGLVRSVLGSNYDPDLQVNWAALDPNRFFTCTFANLGLTTTGNAQTAAGSHVAGRFFYCTDTGGVFYDNGSVYVDVTAVDAPVTTAAASYSAAVTDRDIIVNFAGTHTLTLPAAASYKGSRVTVKTVQAQLVNSASSNVVPLVGGAAGTAILAATAGKWARLASDGANWIIMEGN